MTWDAMIERVKWGETTVDDSKLLELVRTALDHLAQDYPGDGNYFSALGRLLKLHAQMSKDGDHANA